MWRGYARGDGSGYKLHFCALLFLLYRCQCLEFPTSSGKIWHQTAASTLNS